MSRIAVDRNRTAYGGASQIPRPVFGHTGGMENGNYSAKPSRLEQLQSGFQQRRLKEKEEKMIQMYEESQTRALQKVNQNSGKGVLRDFFEERRTTNNRDRSNLEPSMEHMLKQKKLEQAPTNNRFGFNNNNGAAIPQSQIQSKYSKNKNLGQPNKVSAGRDRSNPLAPIQRPAKPSDNPFPNKAKLVRPRTHGNQIQNNVNRENFETVPRSAPTGAYETTDESHSDDTPPPNSQNLKHLHQKRMLLQSQRSNRSFTSTCSTQSKPVSDFQKWQMEQDRNREERLKKYREASLPPPEDEGYAEDDELAVDPNEEIKRKQLELMAQIEAQQTELNRLKQERQYEAEQEAREKEKRRKKEEERKRRMKEEEDRIRREEEEMRIQRQYEEERQRKAQEEKKRMRIAADRFDESEMDHDDYNHSRRSNPPKSTPKTHRVEKPATKPKEPQPKRAPPSTKTSYKPGGEHTAIYDQALNDADAFQNENVNLVNCYNCGRKFAEDRLEKHEQFCKNLTKKRKVMDPTKTRTQGTELEKYQDPRNKKAEPKPKKSNWRTQHESFINSIRYAKKVTEIEKEGGNLADLPPPPAAENPDYVQCPYCTRKFNPGTAERHIPHCKNTKSRPAPPKKR